MDRFDLENNINNFYNFVDNLNDLSYAIMESDLEKDEIVNALDGLAVLIKCHTSKTFETFTKVFKLDQ
jgi:hypothetical protein